MLPTTQQHASRCLVAWPRHRHLPMFDGLEWTEPCWTRGIPGVPSWGGGANGAVATALLATPSKSWHLRTSRGAKWWRIGDGMGRPCDWTWIKMREWYRERSHWKPPLGWENMRNDCEHESSGCRAIWSDERSTIAHGCGAKCTWKWTCQKHLGFGWVRTIWSLKKAHVAVGQNKAPEPEHYWKLRCSKSARGCGAKRVSKSKCQKNTMFGPFLDVELSKKCMRFWLEKDFEVKMLKAHRVRTTYNGLNRLIDRSIDR